VGFASACAVAEVYNGEREEEGCKENGSKYDLYRLAQAFVSKDKTSERTLLRRESSFWSARGSLLDDDGWRGNGVFANLSNELTLFLCRFRVVGGEGGGLGGRCCR
jgi:hypothetical protein